MSQWSKYFKAVTFGDDFQVSDDVTTQGRE